MSNQRKGAASREPWITNEAKEAIKDNTGYLQGQSAREERRTGWMMEQSARTYNQISLRDNKSKTGPTLRNFGKLSLL